ncbi:SLC13 family permease [Echinicola sp. CAU 1574]|uniref:SLC13 family permease n=1 Tax=Echinicola arenosa TaxID=2774144 RepID=A0ABR9AMU4_9BACT|nr:SLC13 family permease [Echinicola arenosa]MBD8490102.1 SLC13 family permease [Echinicola arenosa]
MPTSFAPLYTVTLIIFLVIVLYKDLVRPSMAFISVALLLVMGGVISVDEFLLGLSNKQIIVIFLLIILTAGIQKNIGVGFFYRIFNKGLSERNFRVKLMLFVGGLSAMLNNTPIVAFMIPYVKDWAESNKYAASKFLIPLSYATILGGTITVIGTSTNLVLNGLIGQYGLQLLGFTDFLFLGLLVAVAGVIYLSIASGSLLPDRKENKEEIYQHLNQYLIETYVEKNSRLIGRSVKEAGLRSLKEMYLAEISREGKSITPVSPDEIIEDGDRLFFAGNTKAILTLIQDENGLYIPEESYVARNGYFQLIEAVVPSSSNLIGIKIKNSDFRNRYQASIISIYRKGEQLKGNIGETKVQAGDLFLMLSGGKSASDNIKDLIIITQQGEIKKQENTSSFTPSIIAILALIAGIVGFIDLFMAAMVGIFILFLCKSIDVGLVRKAIDVDLLAILVSSLAIGIALENSGAANFLVEKILHLSSGCSLIFSISLLYLITLLLTSLITNAAAVSIMFPIAMEMGGQLGAPLTPFFVAIAFAASGDFMTPIGYQTNLMVMGPGNYKFKDYFKVGLPLTFIYTIISLLFINFYYLS